MGDITQDQTVRIRMPVGTDAEIDAAKTRGTFAFSSDQRTVAVCPDNGQDFVRLGVHPADAPAASSLGGADLVLIVQGGVLKRTTVSAMAGGGVWQPLDPDLTAIAALTTTAFGRSLLTLAGATETRTAIGAASTADLAGYQPLDSDLTAIATLTTTAFGRGLLPLANAAAVRSYIGAGTVQPGDLSSYQPLDPDLTAIAALTTTAFGRSLLTLEDGAAVRTAIGAGTSSFSGAYASLSGIPASIDAIDGLTPAADMIPYYTGASTGALATLTSFARSLLDDTDAPTARGTLGAAAASHDHTSITGSAAKLTTARSIAATGDAAWSVPFDGSANATAVMTLASIITAAGPVGSSTSVPVITYDAKGRLTAVSSVTVAPAWASITGKPATLAGYSVAATDVTAQPLTGFVSGTNTAIAATDSILAAFQKTQGQIAARLPIANPAFTGTLSQGAKTRIDANGNAFLNAVISEIGAGDGAGGGSYFQLADLTAPTKSWLIQLGGSGDLLLLDTSSGTWTEKWRFLTSGALGQGATERITAGGGFRGTDLRLTELVASAGKIALINANGGYSASAIEQGNITIDTILTQWLAISGPVLALQAAGGSQGLGVYATWVPSAYVPLADDTYSNTVPVRSGWLWNSQRSNHITMSDGAAANAYRGRIRMDRWNGTGFARITGTTAATDFFGLSGDGSPTIPANYLKPFQRAEIGASIAVAAVTQPATLSIWIRGVQVFSRTIGVSSGQQTEITIEANFFIDDAGYALLRGTFRKWQGANLNASEDVRIAWASTTPFDPTLATAIEMKIAPGATSEQWNRGLCWITL